MPMSVSRFDEKSADWMSSLKNDPAYGLDLSPAWPEYFHMYKFSQHSRFANKCSWF